MASRLTKVTDALGYETDYTYNNRNFLTQVQQPDPDGAGSLGRPTSTYSYNNVGQVTNEGQATWNNVGRVYA